MKKSVAYKTALGAILCAQALALSFLEGLIPPLPFLPPGAKPGFSNIITMFAAGSIGLPTAIAITLVKGGFVFVTRGMTGAVMSVSGGLLSVFAMFILLKYAQRLFGLTGISIICALCHNCGQLIAAAFITGTPNIIYYAPALAVFGAVTGAVTGLILKAVMPALEKQKKYFFK
ncbi:MAG: Gx transporter family protein [Clostridia bacterium]|nr:Gx transporter family protein [Clostridia bacterium]